MSQERVLAEEALASIEARAQEYPEAVGFQSYEYFRSDDIAEQKPLFINGELNDLYLSYPRLEQDRVRDIEPHAKDMLVGLLGCESTPKSEALYRALEYRHSEMALVSLAGEVTGSTDAPADDREELLNWFRDTNEALYGKPDAEVFSALADRRIGKLLEAERYSEGSQEALIQQELRALIGEIEPSGYEVFRANPETVSRIGSLLSERLGFLVEHIDPDKTYDSDGMIRELNAALGKLGDLSTGWQAELATDSSALAVSAHKKLVEVGENHKEIAGKRLIPKVIHEVGIHALRSMNAYSAGWLSAAYGQDGYLPFEEGLATALEDAHKGKFVDHGINYYLIAGLAYGQDRHEPRDFREVYEIMWRVNALNLADKKDLDEELITRSKSRAFSNCARMFRGTTTTDKGVIYSKDLAYFNGQELAWSVLENVRTQQDFDALLAGKLDLTRSDHAEIAADIQGSKPIGT